MLSYLARRLVHYNLKLTKNCPRTPGPMRALDDKSLDTILCPKDATTVNLSIALLLDNGEHVGGLIAVLPEIIVVEFAQKVFQVPQSLVLWILNDWS